MRIEIGESDENPHRSEGKKKIIGFAGGKAQKNNKNPI